MKPRDLRHPFKWEERKVLLQDKVLYVPAHCEKDPFSFPGWGSVFGNTHPVYVEYCSGNGEWIAKKAEETPSCNWVAVEKKFERVRKIWSKMKNLQLNNLFVICGEGHQVTSCYFPDRSVEKVFINFPDPWPKTRHAKHRIVSPHFMGEMWRILSEKGEATLVTDDPNYSQVMREKLRGHGGFFPVYPDPFFATQIEGYGTSYFETLWRTQGKTIYFHQYRKK